MIGFIFQQIIAFDQCVALFAGGIRGPLATAIFSVVTVFGSWWFALAVLLLVLFVLLRRRHYRHAAGLVIGFAGTQTFVFAMKYWIGRERPNFVEFTVLNGSLETASFPSAHSAIAMMLYGLLAYFAVSREKRNWLNALYIACAAVFIAAVGFSRIYLGVHYFSDVVAGFVVGAVFLCVAIWIAGKGGQRLAGRLHRNDRG
ncbi:MAG: phosphatase PAP2 family protein [Gammaproteobacteria bacterium]|nr:phosphatase PAP2 family protein [Gammaproteobacteria bacterium]